LAAGPASRRERFFLDAIDPNKNPNGTVAFEHLIDDVQIVRYKNGTVEKCRTRPNQ
jgi:hypothetical protein